MSSTPPIAKATRRRAHKLARANPPSLSRFKSLIAWSVCVPLIVWTFSSSTATGAIKNGVAAVTSGSSVSSAGHPTMPPIAPSPVTHQSNPPVTLSVEPAKDKWDDLVEFIAHEKRLLTSRQHFNTEQKKVEPIEAALTEGSAEDTAKTASKQILLAALLGLGSFFLSLLRLLYIILTYILLPITLPIGYLFHLSIVLPYRISYSIIEVLSPLIALIGGCAAFGVMLGGGAAGLVKGYGRLAFGPLGKVDRKTENEDGKKRNH